MDQTCSEQAMSEDYADFIIEYRSELKELALSQNVCNTIINNTHAVVYLPINSLPDDILHLFGYRVYPSCFGLLDIGGLEASNILKVRSIPNFDLLGQGVLIGIVDTGIDYTHKAFLNADGTSRILSIWDQTIASEQNAPKGFTYGVEYTQPEINLALTSPNPLLIVPSTDEIGHGTFLAGIAAGNPDVVNGFSGVVPNAEIVVVKLKGAKKFIRDFFSIPSDAVCYQENDIMLGIKYLTMVANNYHRPISICIGLGTSQGGHDERGALSSYLSSLSDQRGTAIVIAAGNEGNRRHHYFGTVSNVNEYDTVELQVGPNESGFSMELWGQAPNTFSIDILSPTGEYIPRIPPRLGESREIRFIFENTVLHVDYIIVEEQTGDELILIRFQNPTEGIWRFRVFGSGDLLLRFHIWLPMYHFISANTFFLKPDPYTTLTSPGNTYIPIVTTAYNYASGSLYTFASRGYTRNDHISPDIAAPGVDMIGPGPNNTYTTNSGTSIAAAQTAGVAAMLLEWGILRGNYTPLNTLEIKNLLLRGAKRDPNLTYPNRDWGYGILDLYGAFNSLR